MTLKQKHNQPISLNSRINSMVEGACDSLYFRTWDDTGGLKNY